MRRLEAKRRGGEGKRILTWVAVGLGALIVLLVLGIAVLLHSERFHAYLLRTAQQKATEALGSQAQMRDFAVHWSGISPTIDLYGVVVHGVSRYQIDFEKDKPDEIIARIRDGNLEEVLVERVMPLRRRLRNPSAPTQSIVVFFKRPKDTDDCIEMGMHIEHKHYAVAVRYTP